jgi:hypothetical protein
MKKLTFAIIAFLGLGTVGAMAQVDTQTDNHTVTVVVPEVALLDIESAGSKSFSMTFVANGEAGLGLTSPAANASLWLNYTSVVTAAAPDNVRQINVKLGTAVPGVDIAVTPATPVFTGGTVASAGTSGAAVTLTAAAQDIVTGIGSVYTGDGVNKGVNVSYGVTAPAAAFAALVAGSTAVVVTYTLTDNP